MVKIRTMSETLKKEIEKIFIASSSSDELFDAFEKAIALRISDPDFYQQLIWNKYLSSDEIKMYAEKVCKEFPQICFKIYFSAAQLFATINSYGSCLETAYEYFQKTLKYNKKYHKPYTALADLYNPNIDTPSFIDIVKIIEEGIDQVDVKSELCFALAKLYKTKGDNAKAVSYKKLGEKFKLKGF